MIVRDLGSVSLRILVLALVLSGWRPVLADPTFGRLFFTPEERLAIDRARASRPAADAESGTNPAPDRGPFRLDGVMQRSLGPAVAWIDGRATVLATDAPAAAGDRPAPRLDAEHVAIPMPGGGWLRLRPGTSVGAAP